MTRSRVAVFDSAAGAREWTSVLGRLEVIHAQTLLELLDSNADYGLVCIDRKELPGLSADLQLRASTLPLTILVGAVGGEHPHTRFLRGVLQGKSEWESTFDAILDPLVILSAGGSVLRANRAFAAALGRELAEVLGRNYSELLGVPGLGPNGGAAKLAGQRDPIAQSLADGEARTEEVRYAGLDGVQQVTTSPLVDDLGTGARLVVLLKDMSATKEEQERMFRAARLSDIGQLAAGVAHEINTPLASIALRAESLLRNSTDTGLLAIEAFKNFPRYLKTIDEETFRCKKIIGALLEFASSRKREARPVDLNQLAERAADLVGHQMKLRQVALELDLEPSLPLLPADDGQLRQVLIALMMNALDATAPGGRVEVRTRSVPGAVTLRVSDTGTGIAPEVRDKIFNPFFTTKPPGQGTGLGLALCHGIVVAHGGQIQVESEPGQGTAMSVILPTEA